MHSTGLTRSEKARKLGIECPDHLLWKAWEPGEKHTRTLTIKNVESCAQTITFTLPEHRTTFLTPFPEPVTLSAGMSYELPVQFAPVEQVELHDTMDIQVAGRGSLTVRLDCLTPFAQLRCSPAAYDFGFCAVSRTTSSGSGGARGGPADAITITNTGTVPIDYDWEVPAPFSVSPAYGHLEQGESQGLDVTFSPTDACAVVGQAVCRMMGIEEIVGSVQLSGIGKLPYVRLQAIRAAAEPHAQSSPAAPATIHVPATVRGSKGSRLRTLRQAAAATEAVRAAVTQQGALGAVIRFSDVPVGSVVTHTFTLENPSPVAAHVTVQRLSEDAGRSADGADDSTMSNGETDADATVVVSPASAVIAPGRTQTFSLHFRARRVGTPSIATYELCAAAGNSVQVCVEGTVVGACVRASTSYLDYGDVDLDGAASTASQKSVPTRVLTLTNDSAVAASRFQFLFTAPGAVFEVEPALGVLGPGESARVRVRFRPTMPAHYLRRLFVLTEDGERVLFVDAFGTAYNTATRPRSLTLSDVDAFSADSGAGADVTADREAVLLCNTVGSDSILEYAREGRLGGRRRGTGRLPLITALAQLTAGAARGGGPAAPYTLEPKLLTYGRGASASTSRGREASGDGDSARHGLTQTVSLWNAASSPVIASWVVPGGCPFSVSPAQQEVEAGGAAVFHVAYRPAPPTEGAGGGTGAERARTLAVQSLECYVSEKSMASFRTMADGAAVVPPHCLLLQCRGECAPPLATQPTKTTARRAGGKGAGAGTKDPAASATAPALQVSVVEPHVRFPCCPPGDPAGGSYQVVAIVNHSDSARTFEARGVVMTAVSAKTESDVQVVGSDSEDGVGAASGDANDAAQLSAAGAARMDVADTFTCYPSTGTLAPRQHSLVLFCFRPSCHARFEAEARLQVYSGSTSELIRLRLSGETHQPRLELLRAGPTSRPTAVFVGRRAAPQVVFPPACVTGEVRRRYTLFNPTSLAVAFQLAPSTSLLGVVRFEPAAGELLPRERMAVEACFAPETARHYEGRALLRLRDAAPRPGSRTPPELLMSWPVMGEGTHGQLGMQPAELDCGEVAGLDPHTVSVTLFNSGLCDVCYEVRSMPYSSFGEGASEDSWRPAATLAPTLRNESGVIPARTHTVVQVTLRPTVAGRCEYLLYAMFSGLGTSLREVASPATTREAEQLPHCRLALTVLRPAVQVSDVRSLAQSRSHLWRQLSLSELNAQLAAPVSSVGAQQSHAADAVLVKTAEEAFSFAQFADGLSPVVMRLAAAPLLSPPAVIRLLLENVGSCDASFNLWLPTENDVSEERWFLQDSSLADVQAVMDKRLIEVSPRTGSIPAGGSVVLEVVYRFREAGRHVLPAVMQVGDGRRVLLALEGRTMPLDGDILDRGEDGCPLTTHTAGREVALLPVALGDVEPPMQSVTLLDNPTSRPVRYTVDHRALRRIAEANYGFPLLQCANPTGVLPPRSMAQLHWYFRPLEAKVYTLEVPVLLTQDATDGDSADPQVEDEGVGPTFVFTGWGYHPRKTTPDAVRTLTKQFFEALPPTAPCPGRLLPSLPVVMTPEVLTLGAVPYFTLRRGLCTLVNTHPTDTFFFEWDCAHAYGDHTLTVQPVSGFLAPRGGHVECRLGFYSGSTSQVMEWAVPCRVTNESALQQAMTDGAAVPSGSLHADGSGGGEEVEYFAVDGTGRDQLLADTKVSRGAFERSTCTKPGLARLRRQQQGRSGIHNGLGRSSGGDSSRLPLTTLPAESLGVAAIARQVTAEREQLADDGTAGTVVSAVLELLVQARVMPTEEYARVYGEDRLARAFQPLLRMFQDPAAPPPSAPAAEPPTTLEDARVAGEVLEELLRAVVAQPVVQAAFAEPRPIEPLRYRDVRRAAAPAGAVAAGGGALTGLVGNVLEEALEQLVFQAVVAATDDQQQQQMTALAAVAP